MKAIIWYLTITGAYRIQQAKSYDIVFVHITFRGSAAPPNVYKIIRPQITRMWSVFPFYKFVILILMHVCIGLHRVINIDVMLRLWWNQLENISDTFVVHALLLWLAIVSLTKRDLRVLLCYCLLLFGIALPGFTYPHVKPNPIVLLHDLLAFSTPRGRCNS